MPRNAHRVSEMLDPMPCPMLMCFGFHASLKVAPLNQNQPMIDRPATGMMTPHTVIAPIFPVMPGPPKLAIVVSQINMMTPMHVAIGADDNHGKNAVR